MIYRNGKHPNNSWFRNGLSLNYFVQLKVCTVKHKLWYLTVKKEKRSVVCFASVLRSKPHHIAKEGNMEKISRTTWKKMTVKGNQYSRWPSNWNVSLEGWHDFNHRAVPHRICWNMKISANILETWDVVKYFLFILFHREPVQVSGAWNS